MRGHFITSGNLCHGQLPMYCEGPNQGDSKGCCPPGLETSLTLAALRGGAKPCQPLQRALRLKQAMDNRSPFSEAHVKVLANFLSARSPFSQTNVQLRANYLSAFGIRPPWVLHWRSQLW